MVSSMWSYIFIHISSYYPDLAFGRPSVQEIQLQSDCFFIWTKKMLSTVILTEDFVTKHGGAKACVNSDLVVSKFCDRVNVKC